MARMSYRPARTPSPARTLAIVPVFACGLAIVAAAPARAFEPVTPPSVKTPADLLKVGVVRPALVGRVVDAADRPVAAARVDIATAGPRVGQGIFCPSCYRDCAKWTETDAEGRFRLEDLDPALRFSIFCTAPGKKPHLSKLIDPLLGELSIQLVDAPADLPGARAIRLKLVNQRQQPLRAALVAPEGAKTAERRWWGQVKGVDPAVSDAQGRVAIPLPDDFEGVDLEISADGYAGQALALAAPVAAEQTIVVPEGAHVTGAVHFAGQPVAALRVAVVQVDRRAGHHFIKAVESITDAEGRFEFHNLPADEAYVIYTPIVGNETGYILSTKKFAMPADGRTRDLGKLALEPELRLAGRVELPAGTSLPAGAKLSLGRDPAWDLVPIEIDADGRFALRGVAPESYRVRVPLKGFAVDGAGLPYQMLDAQEFGLRVTRSIETLSIPLVAAPENTRQ